MRRSLSTQVDADGDFLGSRCDADYILFQLEVGTVSPIFDLNGISAGMVDFADFSIFGGLAFHATPPQTQYTCP